TLSGYSTGTINVPKLVRDNGTLQEKNFLFSSKFSDGIMANLLEFFDGFETYFRDDPTDTNNSRGYSQVFAETKPIFAIPNLFPNQPEIVRIAGRAVDIAQKLQTRLDEAESLQSQLSYMQSMLTKFNTPEALAAAPQVNAQVGRAIAAINELKHRLIQTM